MQDRFAMQGPAIYNAAEAVRRTISHSVGPAPIARASLPPMGEYGPMGLPYAAPAPPMAPYAGLPAVQPGLPLPAQASTIGALPPSGGARFTSVRNVTKSIPAMPQAPLAPGIPLATPPPQRSLVSQYSTTQVLAPGQPIPTLPNGAPMITDAEMGLQPRPFLDAPIDPLALKDERKINAFNRNMSFQGDQLRRENEALRAEVHRLKKIEYGWRPKNTEEETHVTIVNNYQNLVNQFSEENTNLKTTLTQLEQENINLRDQLRIADANPRLEKRIEELKMQINKLTLDNNNLRHSATSSTTSIERSYNLQLEGLRNDKIHLEAEIRSLQNQLTAKNDQMSKITQDERNKASSMAESDRMTIQKFKDEIARLQRENLRASTMQSTVVAADPKANEQIRLLKEQLLQITTERDRLSSQIIVLESKANVGPVVEKVFDDSALKDRENLLQHYKLKWDELKAENAKIKSQMTLLQEENQKIKVRADFSATSTPDLSLALKKEKEIQDILRNEAEIAKEEANYYRTENMKLRDQIKSLSSQTSKVETIREVIVDKSGNYAKNLLKNPMGPVEVPVREGEAQIISRSITNNASTSEFVLPAQTTYLAPQTTTTHIHPGYSHTYYAQPHHQHQHHHLHPHSHLYATPQVTQTTYTTSQAQPSAFLLPPLNQPAQLLTTHTSGSNLNLPALTVTQPAATAAPMVVKAPEASFTAGNQMTSANIMGQTTKFADYKPADQQFQYNTTKTTTTTVENKTEYGLPAAKDLAAAAATTAATTSSATAAKTLLM